MNFAQKQVLEFKLEGKITDLICKSNDQIKHLKVMTHWGELYWIKLAKHLRRNDSLLLHPGQIVQISGAKKVKKTGQLKLTAYQITPIYSNIHNSTPGTPERNRSAHPASQVSPACGKILVCQKSDCRKRGGEKVCQVLESVLAQQGLDDHVTIQPTGCLKDCKAGPNLVVMPHKTRYRRIQPAEVPGLVKKHFINV